MKTKLIYITYLNNGNLKSQIAKECLFNRVVSDLLKENRVIANSVIRPTEKQVIFEDGTKVMCQPFSMSQRGIKVTSIFVDAELLSMPNGEEAVKKTFYASLVPYEYEELDSSEQYKFNAFEMSGNSILLTPISLKIIVDK